MCILNTVLAALYSSEGSVMERHHFAQSMCILNTEGCNILDNLSKADYTRCLDLIRDNILSTDLAHHLRMLPEMEKMVSEGVRGEDANHHYLTSCLIMTASDLSDQTKEDRGAGLQRVFHPGRPGEGDGKQANGVDGSG